MSQKSFSELRAVMDNSAFAGVMRLYCPDMETHQQFLRQYPSHRPVDELSLADFLTAIVLYGKILLEGSSRWNDREAQREGYSSSDPILHESVNWADSLAMRLPQKVRKILYIDDLSEELSASEDSACDRAYEIMCSPLGKKLLLSPEEKIPDVYTSPSYVYRPKFELLNEENGGALGETELAQAMFLHRGLYLQEIAHDQRCVYLPYYHRGKMLSNLPPLSWVDALPLWDLEDIEDLQPQMIKKKKPTPEELNKQVNAIYYSMLEKVSWCTYAADIPFIGAAILAKAGGDAGVALNIACELREEGKLSSAFAALHKTVEQGERAKAERILEAFREELASAAKTLGAKLDSQASGPLYKLIGSVSKTAESLIQAIVGTLPRSLREWGETAGAKLITKSPLQMLFLDHARSISPPR